MVNKLFLKLLEKQGDSSDYKFASNLDIERSLWTHTRLGNRQISITILRAVVRHLPDLIPDVIDYLRSNHGQT